MLPLDIFLSTPPVLSVGSSENSIKYKQSPNNCKHVQGFIWTEGRLYLRTAESWESVHTEKNEDTHIHFKKATKPTNTFFPSETTSLVMLNQFTTPSFFPFIAFSNKFSFSLPFMYLTSQDNWWSVGARSVAQSCLTLCDPMDYIVCQAPLSMEFSRQEYWSELPFTTTIDVEEATIFTHWYQKMEERFFCYMEWNNTHSCPHLETQFLHSLVYTI